MAKSDSSRETPSSHPASAAGGVVDRGASFETWQSPVSARLRFFGVLLTWTILVSSLPGIGRPTGFGHSAFFALVAWAHICSRPGKKAFLVEWIGTAFGFAGVCWFLGYVVPASVVIVPLTDGLYMAAAGIALRRMARRYPLALAVPAAWVAAEVVRFSMVPPIAWGWHRIAVSAHDSAWLVGSARVWGSWGLAWVLAAFSGYFADLWRAYRPQGDERPMQFSHARLALFGLGPLFMGVTLNYTVRAPATVDGPRVLCVQPGITQEVKSFGGHPIRDLFGDAVELTAQGLEESAQRGEPVPDLVLWGETMLPIPVAGNKVLPAMDKGMRRPVWARDPLNSQLLTNDAYWARALYQGVLFGQADKIDSRYLSRLREYLGPRVELALGGQSVIPAGTSFLGGVQEYTIHEDEIRRLNSLAIWGADGKRGPTGSKVYLVPGGETLMGMHRFEFVLDMMFQAGGYIPDFISADESGVLPFTGRDGRDWRVGVSVCFDNSFDAPFTVPARRERLDFHVVASNEAWYKDSFEMAHMVAFSKLIAIETGRSVVRATNSGISCVIDPNGRLVAELTEGKRRRMVRGTLAATVPVPEVLKGGGGAPNTLFVTFESQIRVSIVLLAALLVVFSRRRVTPA
ncbi:MAG: apolipoprotein N-acyltransferase [Planctomycetota bacterium]|jgi:apolipoprotein N-acyltransferase